VICRCDRWYVLDRKLVHVASKVDCMCINQRELPKPVSLPYLAPQELHFDNERTDRRFDCSIDDLIVNCLREILASAERFRIRGRIFGTSTYYHQKRYRINGFGSFAEELRGITNNSQ
jgi:hypothetical protein